MNQFLSMRHCPSGLIETSLLSGAVVELIPNLHFRDQEADTFHPKGNGLGQPFIVLKPLLVLQEDCMIGLELMIKHLSIGR